MKKNRNFSFSGLRLKVVLFFIIPLMVAMGITTFSHFVREQELIAEQVELTAIQLADLVTGGLRHAMLLNDSQMILEVMKEIEKQENISQVWLVDLDGVIRASSHTEMIGEKEDTAQLGCVECHQYSAENRPRVAHNISKENVMRVSTPIKNATACHECHDSQEAHLGVLFLDSSLADIEQHLRRDLLINLSFSMLIILLLVGFGYVLIQRMIVGRIETVHNSLSEYAAGNSSVRIPRNLNNRDEISQLAETFNEMADRLERQGEAQREVQRVREEAIVEERERIARELHDGVAQFLGYLSTKVIAIRQNIHKNQYEKAEMQLTNVADTVSQQSIDVRASILGLKMAGKSGVGLADQIRDFAIQAGRMSDLPIEVNISPQAEVTHFDPEVELQLLRILQEAISNVRKHANATLVEISLSIIDEEIILKVSDNGVGFDPWQLQLGKKAAFGLQIMHERADAVNASLSIQSTPDEGTILFVRLMKVTK